VDIQSRYASNFERLSPNQIQKLLNQYLVADYEQPINGEIMKAVASRVTEKSDVLLLTAVDMDDSGPYEIAEPRVITALETYTPSCKTPYRLHDFANTSQGSKPPNSSDSPKSYPRRRYSSKKGRTSCTPTATASRRARGWP
jgi:hypothetical protein